MLCAIGIPIALNKSHNSEVRETEREPKPNYVLRLKRALATKARRAKEASNILRSTRVAGP